MATRKPQRFAVAFDNHGDKHDPAAVKVFHEFCGWFKPDLRIHGGDCFNFACLRKKASEEEKRERLNDDVEAGIEFLRTFKPTHFLRGNHDERLWDAAAGDDGKLADLASYLIVDIKEALKDAVMYPYDKRKGVMRMGHLKVIHGYHSGVTAARQAALVYGSVLMGHVHAVDHYAIPGLERRMGRACGCLCALDQEYNRAQAQTLRQSHGFPYGMILPSGEYVVWQAEPIGNTWFFPSEIREIHASGNGKKA